MPPRASSAGPDRPANPYLGPRPFEQQDAGRFYGREREAAELVSLLIAHRTVLLYAQSGAGKSSLLNARLIPLLMQRGFAVKPVLRVNLAHNFPSAPTGSIPNLVIFDQFEELFTISRNRVALERFFEDVASEMEKSPMMRLHLVMREDYLAACV